MTEPTHNEAPQDQQDEAADGGRAHEMVPIMGGPVRDQGITLKLIRL